MVRVGVKVISKEILTKHRRKLGNVKVESQYNV